MAEIRDVARFWQSRWSMTRHGYEVNLGGCAFGDIDHAIERHGRVLIIESKHHPSDRVGLDYPSSGQGLLLRALRCYGADVWLLYGDAPNDDPHAVRVLGYRRDLDVFHDLRPLPVPDRRRNLHELIDDWWRAASATPTPWGTP